MRSDTVKKGVQQATHRSLFNALGMTQEERKTLLLNAADAAFLTEEERWRLKDVIEKVC